jgi:hypothetical protein
VPSVTSLLELRRPVSATHPSASGTALSVLLGTSRTRQRLKSPLKLARPYGLLAWQVAAGSGRDLSTPRSTPHTFVLEAPWPWVG